jgi:hypothetical protein
MAIRPGCRCWVMAKEALAAFEATLKKEPNRLAGRDAWRRLGREKVRRFRQGTAALRGCNRALRECRSGQTADRARPRVRGDESELKLQSGI